MDDASGPLPSFASWPTFPFEGELKVKALDEPVATEPSRHGENPAECRSCLAPDDAYIWVSERWRVRSLERPTGLPAVLILESRSHLDLGDLTSMLSAELGVMTVRMERAIRSLEGVARVHVNRWGDGSAHLHLWFLARPVGRLQLRGTFLPLWDEILPPIDEKTWRENLALVAAWLAEYDGRALAEPPRIEWHAPSAFTAPPSDGDGGSVVDAGDEVLPEVTNDEVLPEVTNDQAQKSETAADGPAADGPATAGSGASEAVQDHEPTTPGWFVSRRQPWEWPSSFSRDRATRESSRPVGEGTSDRSIPLPECGQTPAGGFVTPRTPQLRTPQDLTIHVGHDGRTVIEGEWAPAGRYSPAGEYRPTSVEPLVPESRPMEPRRAANTANTAVPDGDEEIDGRRSRLRRWRR